MVRICRAAAPPIQFMVESWHTNLLGDEELAA
jgi:hypothetical protein